MRACEWFNRYRDGELSAAHREQFEAHLSGCPACRARMALLDNMVHALRLNPAPVPPGLPERIARRAFERPKPWDSLVISWLRPAPVLITLVVALFVFSSLWVVPGSRKTETAGEYEVLVNESYSLNTARSSGPSDDMLTWLEQEGATR